MKYACSPREILLYSYIFDSKLNVMETASVRRLIDGRLRGASGDQKTAFK